jgi:hypothetical protein
MLTKSKFSPVMALLGWLEKSGFLQIYVLTLNLLGRVFQLPADYNRRLMHFKLKVKNCCQRTLR